MLTLASPNNLKVAVVGRDGGPSLLQSLPQVTRLSSGFSGVKADLGWSQCLTLTGWAGLVDLGKAYAL